MFALLTFTSLMSMFTDVLKENVPQNLKYLKQENKTIFSWWCLKIVPVQKLTLSSILLNVNVIWLFQQWRKVIILYGDHNLQGHLLDDQFSALSKATASHSCSIRLIFDASFTLPLLSASGLASSKLRTQHLPCTRSRASYFLAPSLSIHLQSACAKSTHTCTSPVSN